MLTQEEILEVSVDKQLPSSWLDYAMSVIFTRAIPDVRDGLKPVHRRILWAMYELGMHHNRPHKKSARIVGEVIGKYHPHGDSAVYESMVRLAQSFKVRVPLIDSHGNFGSIDGDRAAAMRYTEARLQKVTSEILKDLKDENGKLTNNVDYVENFDGEEREPAVLPGKLPQLLINGSEGIAVGMATSMPPHNLKEICQAIIARMENPEITVEELMEFVQGPDFPTGGIVLGKEGFKNAYLTGKGSIVLRGLVEREYIGNEEAIVIRQIPYQVNKTKLINQIKQIQKDYNITQSEMKKKGAKKIVQKGINFLDDIRDETEGEDPTKLRIVIYLKSGVNPEQVIKYLYKNTQLQQSYGIINLALAPKRKNGEVVRLEPKVMNLLQLIEEYIAHQQEVTKRTLQYGLNKKESEMYYLGALITALSKLDETVELIKAATSREEAISSLMNFLNIEEEQAASILRLRLQTLTNYQREEKIQDHITLGNEIKEIKEIIASPERMNSIIKEDLERMIEEYSTARNSAIAENMDEISDEELIPSEDVVITMSKNGLIKRISVDNYRVQRKNGRGVNGMSTIEGDYVKHLQIANTHDTLMFFTNLGQVYKAKAYQIPVTNAQSKGVSVRTIFDIQDNEYIQDILVVSEFTDDQYVVFGTKKGYAKRTKLSEYNKSSRNGIIAISLNEDDEVVNVALTNGDSLVTLITKNGISITFKEEESKAVSRQGKGVMGIELAKKDEVVSVAVHKGISQLFIATNLGVGKRVDLSEFRVQNRKGKGVKAITVKNGHVIGTCVVEEDDQIILLTQSGLIIRMNVKEVSNFGRAAQGSSVINLKEGDFLQAIDRNSETENDTQSDDFLDGVPLEIEDSVVDSE